MQGKLPRRTRSSGETWANEKGNGKGGARAEVIEGREEEIRANWSSTQQEDI